MENLLQTADSTIRLRRTKISPIEPILRKLAYFSVNCVSHNSHFKNKGEGSHESYDYHSDLRQVGIIPDGFVKKGFGSILLVLCFISIAAKAYWAIKQDTVKKGKRPWVVWETGKVQKMCVELLRPCLGGRGRTETVNFSNFMVSHSLHSLNSTIAAYKKTK